jgi:hypothetical protein
MYRSQVALGASFIISAGILVAAIGGTSHLKVDFSGGMRVPVGGQERLALRLDPSHQASAPDEDGSFVSRLPGSAIPLQHPATARNWIDPDASYLVAQLPFLVRLDSAEVVAQPAPRDRIQVTSPEGEQTYTANPGDTISLPDTAMRIAAVRKWSGLLRQEGGRPMAAVALRHGQEAWSEQLFLTAGIWLRVGEDMGLLLHWVESEEAARDALAAGLPAIATPRWCVVDRGAANWFVSFVPGTGAGLPGGGSVTLLKYRERKPDEGDGRAAILVEIEQDGKTERRWVVANESDEDSLVRFDHPLGRPVVFVLLAWQERQALAVAYRASEPCGTALLEGGQSWEVEKTGWHLRLAEVIASAIPVAPDDSPLFEAIVEIEQEELRLREGEAVRWHELMLQFGREALPPVLRYHLSLIDETGSTMASFVLDRRSSMEFQGWRLAQGVVDPRSPDTGVFVVSKMPQDGMYRWGLLLALIGLAGLCCSVFFPKRIVTPGRW